MGLKGDKELDILSKTPQAVIPTDKKTEATIDAHIIKPSDKIKMNVLRGRNLEKQKFGKPDPYVIISYGEQIEKPKIVQGNLNPEWNLEKIFTVTKDSPKEILLEVYDKDKVTKDDFMGRVYLSISDIPKYSKSSWIPLKECKCGEVFLNVNVISSPDDKGAIVTTETKTKKSDVHGSQIEVIVH